MTNQSQLKENIKSKLSTEEILIQEMATWLSLEIKVVYNISEVYAKILYNKGIGSIDKLAKKLQKNRQFLHNEKEIDEDDLELIIEKLTKTPKTTYNNSINKKNNNNGNNKSNVNIDLLKDLPFVV